MAPFSTCSDKAAKKISVRGPSNAADRLIGSHGSPLQDVRVRGKDMSTGRQPPNTYKVSGLSQSLSSNLDEALIIWFSIVEDSLMAKNWAGSNSSAASQQELDRILNGDYRNAFNAQDYFSVDNSTGHVFDVIDGNGIMRSNVGGDTLVKIIKVS